MMGLSLVPRDDKAARAAYPKPYRVFNYTVTWPCEDARMLFYRDGRHTCAVILEHNDAFSSILSAVIAQTGPDL